MPQRVASLLVVLVLALVVLALALALTSCLLAPPPAVTPGALLETMTLEEKVGQLFFVSANGIFLADDAPAFLALARLVETNRVGGLIWFRSSVLEAATLAARLQARARIPLLVSADLESGAGMRFPDLTYGPWAMAVAAAGDLALAERYATVTALEARALGIHQVYAPVADVNIDPDNPVINVRSFGEDPEEVSRYVAATVRGLQAGGVTATLKHFPGHGDTHVDSHLTLPVITASLDRLQKVELAPFRAGLAAGARSVMVAHIAVPAVDTAPASLSRPVVTGLLREKLGFDGLAVTDAMTMKALEGPPDEQAVRAVDAGIDVVLMSPDPEGSIAAVVAAVRSGRIPMERIDRSVRRILEEKERLGLFRRPEPTALKLTALVGTRDHAAVSEEVARRSMTLVREEEKALPLDRTRTLAVLAILDEATAAALEEPFLAALRKRFGPRLSAARVDPRSTPAEVSAAVTTAGKADQLLVAFFVRARSGSGAIAVPAPGAEALRQLAPGTARTVAVSFGSPYLLREFPGLETFLAAWGSQEVAQTAAAAALLGEAPIGGRLPVTIPGVAAKGTGLQRAAR